MDFTARLSRVNSRPSRTDDSQFVTTVMLECHDLREAGVLTSMLGRTVEVRIDAVPTPMSPMERAINETLSRTPVVRTDDDGKVTAHEDANARVVEAEADDFAPADAPEPTTNGTTAIEHVPSPGRRSRRRG